MATYTYLPFGMTNGGLNSSSSNSSYKYRYNGKELNQDLGLYDYGARNYDPATGRWLQVDPLAEHPNQIDKSPYAYGWNNPVKYDDPDGKCPNRATAGVGALIGGAVGFVGSVMRQSLEGEVDFGQALIDECKGAVAGAIVGSGSDLTVAAAEATPFTVMMFAGGLSTGSAMAGEAAGQGVEIATGRRVEMNAEKIVVTGAIAGLTSPLT